MAFPRQGQDCHRFRLYEDGDPTVSLVTREIAGFSGGDFLSRVINRLAADRRGAVELWMSVLQSNRANSICSWSLGQPFQVGNEQQAADSGPDETTSQPLPLDLLVAQDSALSSNHGEPAAARIDEVQNLMPELPSSLALRKSKAHRNSLSCKGPQAPPPRLKHNRPACLDERLQLTDVMLNGAQLIELALHFPSLTGLTVLNITIHFPWCQAGAILAVAVGMTILLRKISGTQSLQHMRLAFTAPDGSLPDTNPAYATCAFTRVMDELRSAVSSMPWLQSLHVHMPLWCRQELQRGQQPATNDLEKYEEWLRDAAECRRVETRLALLLGTHHRCGSRSPLRLLSHDELQQLVQLSAPVRPSFRVTCAEPGQE